MLGRKGELRPRLPGHVISLPNIHFGQHWRADARSRWSAVMSSRFSEVQELARHQYQTGFPDQHGTLMVRAVGLPF